MKVCISLANMYFLIGPTSNQKIEFNDLMFLEALFLQLVSKSNFFVGPQVK